MVAKVHATTMTIPKKITKEWTNEAHKTLVLSRERERERAVSW